MTTISMPLCVRMGVQKPKNFYFNLNNYRNWHYQVSNNLKRRYKEIVDFPCSAKKAWTCSTRLTCGPPRTIPGLLT